MIKLQDIISAVEQAGEGADVPAIVAQVLADNPDADLNAISAEAQGEFGSIDVENPSDESIAALETLVAISESVQQAASAAEAATAERAAAVASLSDRMSALGAREDTDTPADPSAVDEDAPAEEPDAPVDGPEDPVAKAAGADAKKKASTAQSDTPAAGVDAPVQEAAPIAASGAARRRVPLGSLPRKQEPTPTEAPGVAIVAAANVKGIAAGTHLDGLDGLTAAVQAKIEALPTGYVPNAVIKENVATIRRPFPKELVASADRRDDTEVLNYAADHSRLDGGSLVAAGGWCSPSETLYELPGILADAKAGLIDVPDIQVNRGGIRFNRGLDFKNIYAGVGFAQTEAQAIAGTEKTFWHIPCVDPWIDVRSDVVGFGLIAGVLQQDAYPEVGREATAGALAAHAHKVNASTISRMVAEATNVGTVTLGPSVTTAVLGGLEQQVVDVRYGYRAPETMQLEAILPLWLKPLIRQDLSLRTGIAFDQVDDGAITGYFAKRGVRVQFVYDWQDSFTSATTPSTGFGGADAYKDWPDTVQALIYPAGTYVRGRGEVLSLDTIYDSTNLKINDYIQLFVEEKLLVARRAYSARLVTFPTLVNGVTSQPRQLDGNGVVVPATP
ncbi:major capsid protein [Tsukamurella sp. DT100]|uniref:major capsid protein n=1 Tax=Tsukamurella sp. DT100 TaxID=3393415 RepID=UPI003CF65094